MPLAIPHSVHRNGSWGGEQLGERSSAGCCKSQKRNVDVRDCLFCCVWDLHSPDRQEAQRIRTVAVCVGPAQSRWAGGSEDRDRFPEPRPRAGSLPLSRSTGAGWRHAQAPKDRWSPGYHSDGALIREAGGRSSLLLLRSDLGGFGGGAEGWQASDGGGGDLHLLSSLSPGVIARPLPP